jgi:hypothetical protein
MQAYYRSVIGQATSASPEERQALRSAMVDYGALQTSPVQKPVNVKPLPDTTLVRNSLAHKCA